MSSTTSAFAPPDQDDQRSHGHDPYRVGRGSGRENESTGHGSGGPSAKRIVVAYGFWIFILSDVITFSTLFAAYAVLKDNTAGGPSGAQLFDRGSVAVETLCLLLSSFTCGMASLTLRARHMLWFQLAMLATAALGVAFLLLEAREFAGLVAQGAGPSRSAFLSAFFTLVGCHGLHVTGGLLWLLTMMAQVLAKGFRDDILRRVACWALFWHALDIVWVGVFTVVYLMGVRRMSPVHGSSPRRDGISGNRHGDSAPGEQRHDDSDLISGIRSYLIGLGLAALLTAGSFYLSGSNLVYGPGVPVALIVFAIAQIGIHLVFFLHLTTSPDNINNAMALAFGVLIIGLLIGGSLWIMTHMNHNMMPMSEMLQMQR